MTEQEQINSDVQMKLAMQDAKFNAFVEEMRDFKQEMRDRDNQRAEEIRELRQRQDAAQAKHDADMKEMNAKIEANFQTFTKQLHSNFVQTLIGVGAIMAAIGGLLIAALK